MQEDEDRIVMIDAPSPHSSARPVRLFVQGLPQFSCVLWTASERRASEEPTSLNPICWVLRLLCKDLQHVSTDS